MGFGKLSHKNLHTTPEKPFRHKDTYIQEHGIHYHGYYVKQCSMPPKHRPLVTSFIG